tara:strand:- start:1293 stop:1838 length:546 start_codon:yes stop_codon:yes gene_type:complete
VYILKKIINLNNTILFSILIVSVFLGINNMIEGEKITVTNQKLLGDELIIDGDYEELTIYSSAYLLGKQGEFENAIEKYNMLLKKFPNTNKIDVVYFNIATNYLQDALTKPLSDDGMLTIENFQKLQSSVIAYEKVLQLNPYNELAKFNLSILYSSMPKEPSKIISEQAVQELSNIPIGLP